MEDNREKLKGLEAEARRLRRMGCWDSKAVEANTKVLEVDPNSTAALNRRAKSYREAGDLFAARADYERAQALKPKDPNIQRVIREIKEELKRQSEQEKFIEKVKSISNFSEVYDIGRSFKNKPPAKRSVAVEALKQAFRLDRSRIDVLIELAAVHRTLRQRDEAERIYKWIIDRDNNSAAKIGLAAIYKDRKRLKEALTLCEEVLAEQPHNSHALRGHAGILSESDRGEEARESFKKSWRG